MNAEQQHAFDLVTKGRNIFLSGQAGTGKSYTIRKIVSWAHEEGRAVGVTATTGMAALLIGGRTVHSFLGIGLGKKTAVELVRQAKKSPYLCKRLKELSLLVIDEVSMLHAELLEKIHEYLSLVRGSMCPFGGVQIVLCGDLTQLPPIEGAFCFQAPCWNQAKIQTVLLTESIRQAEDKEFQAMLEELRFGRCAPTTLAKLDACKDTEFEDGILPTLLYSRNVDVDAINQREYMRLVEKGSERRVYPTKYASVPHTQDWAKANRIPEQVELCVGAQVLVTWNVTIGESVLPNGARGVVQCFTSGGPLVRFRHGKEHIIHPLTVCNEEENKNMSATFMPLKLAYAITIHKSQGMTIDAVEMDLGKSIFQEGQAYTALSRARNLSSVRIVAVSPSSFRVHKDVKAFYESVGK